MWIKFQCLSFYGRPFYILINSYRNLRDAIVLVDECQLREFNGLPNPNVHVIYDAPPDFACNFIKSNSIDETFKIFYPGIFFRARQLNLDKIIDFVLKTDNVQLTISGYGDMKDEIIELADKMPNKIKYVGWVESRADLFQMMYNSDLTFAFKDIVCSLKSIHLWKQSV
jgi:glycosyltransferase involved in cell wall biosynthesis